MATSSTIQININNKYKWSNKFLLDHALSMDNVCNRRLFSFPAKVEMAEEQEYL